MNKAVTLLGAGTQGRRLAFMWSRRGRPVYLIDKNPTQLSAAQKEIDAYRADSQWSKTAGDPSEWGNLHTGSSEDLADAVGKSWLVVECVPESLKLKRTVVQQLDELAGGDTIVASNSSSYAIAEIVQDLSLQHADRCVSLHSYWPPETAAIEIMGTSKTKSEILSQLQEQTERHGFKPFLVHKSSNGYIYNRIWAAIKRETLLVLAQGVASPEEIDAIFKDVLKSPKGPCEQMDVVGLDVVHDIEQHYADDRAGIPTEPRELLKKMIEKGQLGVKSGKGFYEYKQK